jgi:hypothetical protein
MARHRTPLPAELKELISLIRQGRLFEVQEWIRDGKPISLPDEGRFAISPAMAAVRVGFHSMVKVLLDVAAHKEDLDDLLAEAVSLGRLDLCVLLHEYGASPGAISYDSVASTHNPIILRWFEDHGIDLETDHALATALRWRIRAALGTYMRRKEHLPQLKQQIDMALRFHARKGDMKWVSLLLWAGADPRAEVSSLDPDVFEEELGTALKDAIAYGKVEVVRKFKVDRRRDDIGVLLEKSGLSSQPEIVDLLLSAGGASKENSEVVKRNIRSLGWTLEGDWFRRDPKPIVECLCLLASKGMKWTPTESCEYRYLRKGLARAQPSDALDVLNRLVSAGLFAEAVFKELVSTPRMRELLGPGRYGASALREFAGFEEPRPRRRRRQRVA